MLRHIGHRWVGGPATFTVPTIELAGCVGFGASTGRNRLLTRTLLRLERFGLLDVDDQPIARVALSAHVPVLSRGQLH